VEEIMMKFVVLACLVADADAFKFLSNFKAASLIPRPSNMIKRRKATAKFGTRKLAIITGASSGVGLQTAAALLRTGEYHVVGAARDLEKMNAAARDEDFGDDFTPLHLDLNSFDSVRRFSSELDKMKLNKPIDRLICNAAVYNPGEEPTWSDDGHEQTVQTNYLSHFLLVSLLLKDLGRAPEPRVLMVGAASATESVSVYPRADLCELEGLKAGFCKPVSMLDGYNYNGAKAYKDSKLCMSMLSNMLHDRCATRRRSRRPLPPPPVSPPPPHPPPTGLTPPPPSARAMHPQVPQADGHRLRDSAPRRGERVGAAGGQAAAQHGHCAGPWPRQGAGRGRAQPAEERRPG
jgi:NAD(P)-dependent dehydrogenase (short-subunit alcohol dehydrogenase family)